MRFRRYLRRERWDRERSWELEDHLAHEIDDNLDRGMAPEEARRQAYIKLGNPHLIREEIWKMNSFGFLESLFADCRYAWRQMWKSPIFTAAAILTLAIGIGATVSIFSFVDAVLLKPLAYRDSGQLVAVWERTSFLAKLYPQVGPNALHAAIWQQQSTVFQDSALFQAGAGGVSLDGKRSMFLGTVKAEPDLLRVLGVQPILGRSFTPDEGVGGKADRAIISWTLWEQLFQGRPDVLGKTLYIGTRPLQIIGVLPHGFYFPTASDLNAGLTAQAAPAIEVLTPFQPTDYSGEWNSDYGNFAFMGRLKPGISPAQARAQLDSIDREIIRKSPAGVFNSDSNIELSSIVVPFKEAIIGKTGVALWLLFAAVLSVLLIACPNIANAQIAKAMTRDREFAVRAALGASRWRLLQTAFIEILLVSLLGGSIGLIAAEELVRHSAAWIEVAIPRAGAVAVSPAVLWFSVMCTLGVALLIGIVPALRSMRSAPQASLAGSGRSAGKRQSGILRQCMIGVQILACTALLLLTALFSRSLLRLLESEQGMSADHVVLAEVRFQGKEYDEHRRAAFDDAVLTKLQAVPGVAGVGLVSSILGEGQTWLSSLQAQSTNGTDNALVEFRWISPGYFETLHQRLISGRYLTAADRTAKVAVINQATARAVWPGMDPLGRHFKQGGDSEYTVVGVVEDVRSNSLREAPVPMAFYPYWDNVPVDSFLLVRTDGSPEAWTKLIRKTIWNYDPAVTIAAVDVMTKDVAAGMAPERIEATTLGLFGVAAWAMALLGIYATLTYSVQGRMQEIGVRIALGATRSHVYWLTYREVALPIGFGLAGGWLLSLGVDHAVKSLLSGTARVDAPLALGIVCIFACASAAAAYLPCRRATRVDPVIALRAE